MSSVAPTLDVEQPTVVVIRRRQSSLKLILAAGSLLLISFFFLDYFSITGPLSIQTLPVQRSSTQQCAMVTDASATSVPSTEPMSSVISASMQQRMLGWIKKYAVEVAVFSVAVMIIIALVVALVVVLNKPEELEEVVAPKQKTFNVGFTDESYDPQLGYWFHIKKYLDMAPAFLLAAMSVVIPTVFILSIVFSSSTENGISGPNHKAELIKEIMSHYRTVTSTNDKESLKAHADKVFKSGLDPRSIVNRKLEVVLKLTPTGYSSSQLTTLLAHYGEEYCREGIEYGGPYIYMVCKAVKNSPNLIFYNEKPGDPFYFIQTVSLSDEALEGMDCQSLEILRNDVLQLKKPTFEPLTDLAIPAS